MWPDVWDVPVSMIELGDWFWIGGSVLAYGVGMLALYFIAEHVYLLRRLTK